VIGRGRDIGVVFRACPASLENHGLAEALTLREFTKLIDHQLFVTCRIAIFRQQNVQHEHALCLVDGSTE
jgi:hypothetical protein